MKKKIIHSVSVLLMGVFFTVCLLSQKAEAAENGGAVQTNGVISFYDDTVPSSSIEEPTPSSEEPKASSEPVVQKPVGKYPSTGELVKTSLSISGIAVIVLVFFFFWKRKKDHETEEEIKK